MKTYLLKFICLVALVSFFGCSTEDSEDIIEDNRLETKNTKIMEDETLEGRAFLQSVVVYVQCPVGLSSCWSDLNNYITVYHSEPSTVCPGMLKVWVDAVEFSILYPSHIPGVGTVLREPFGVRVPTRLSQIDLNNCFPQ